MLEKSHYFRSITKSCFADHKLSEFTEVTIPVNFESFKKAVHYLNTGIIDLSIDNVFEIFQISDYLEIEGLRKNCLDHFICNLNIKTLDDQLSLMEKYPMLSNDFKEFALKFKESGRPSVKGFYLLEIKNILIANYNTQKQLRLMSNGPDYVIKFDNIRMGNLVHNFFNNIIMDKYECDGSYVLFHYNLLTGKIFDIEIQYTEHSSICSNNKHLFVVNPIKSDQNYKFSLSILGKKSYEEVLKVDKTKVFSLPIHSKHNIDGDSDVCMLFSICDDSKLYLFYKLYSNGPDSLLNALMITICIETMTIVKNKILTDSLKCCIRCIRGVITRRDSINIQYILFSKLFFLKKVGKCFIKLSDFGDTVLVFDLKHEYFYYVQDVFFITGKNDIIVKYTVDKDDILHRYRLYKSQLDSKPQSEIKAFQFSNDKFVETGINCQLVHKSDWFVNTICNV